jgi:hypothetical protein
VKSACSSSTNAICTLLEIKCVLYEANAKP